MLQHNRSETFSEKFISRRCQSMLVFRLNTRSDINCLPNGFSIVSTYLRLPGFRLITIGNDYCYVRAFVFLPSSGYAFIPC